MFRESTTYKGLLADFNTAVKKVGCEDGNVGNLIGRLDVDYLEDLMIASYKLMKHLREYLRNSLKTNYIEALRVPDFFTALEKAIEIVKPSVNQQFVSVEADRMENISRAAYAWLKSYRLLSTTKLPSNEPGYWLVSAKHKESPRRYFLSGAGGLGHKDGATRYDSESEAHVALQKAELKRAASFATAGYEWDVTFHTGE